MNFFTKLINAIERNQSLLCVGLDPVAGNLPAGSDHFTQLVDWCAGIISDTQDLVCCYKPNIAFFEQFGPEGLRALTAIIKLIPPEIPVLLDAKRGDIGSSAEAYARGIYGAFGADAVTLSPYLGQDSIRPFIKDPDKAAFILCQTSNPSAGEIQGHGSPSLFEFIAEKTKNWGSVDQLGLVVGATKPEALKIVREICPEHWFLAPGVGAQGGDLGEALTAGLRADGLGMIIPVSRSVINAPDPRQAALEIRESINAFRQTFSPQNAVRKNEKLITKMFKYQCIKFGDFTLVSGRKSPIYVDLRRVVSFPDLFKAAAEAYVDILRELEFDLISGVPYAALPLCAVAAWQLNYPMIYPRKEPKAHGTGQNIEGAFQPGQRVILVEDVITSGSSILKAAETLRTAGLVVSDVVVLVDRKQGGSQALLEEGIVVHPVLDIFEIMDILKSNDLIDSDTHTLLIRYLQEN